MNSIAARFDERHARVLERVRLLRSFLRIAAVLRPAVADQKKKLRARLFRPQLGRRVADSGPHPRRMERTDTAKTFGDV